MKENKKTITMIIITIAVLLVAIIGATYAYFATERNVGSSINAGVATAKSSAFSSSTSGNIEFNVDFNEMSQAGVSNEYIKTDNATLSVDLTSEDERSTIICNYDVVWIWDSTDRYTQSDVVLPYTHNDIEYPYEFSVQVGTDVEKDLSSLSWDYDGTAIISSKTIEVAQKGSKHEDYDVIVRMYNIPVNQENLFNKEFKAHIKVENLNCTSVRETKLAYYVISSGTETKVDTVPKGDYRLNTDRTKCKKGGTVSAYNSITGELTTNIQMGDECEIYFDELPVISASGSTLSTNYDGTSKELNISVSNVTDYEVYYSLDKELTRENYTEGSTTHPEVKEIGTTKVYWCAVAENYAPYCSSNDIVIGEGIISLNVSDYNEAYDGNPHKLVISDLVPSTATMYYSETTPLTKDNYSTDGKTDEPERTTAGTSIIYWCAVADKYTPQCGENKIIVNPLTMTASGTNYNGEPDEAAHSITVNVTKPVDGYDIYYSTTTELTKDNYSTSGTTTNPTRSELGTTIVYWCAVAPNYNPVCSSNNIIIDYPSLASYIMDDVYNSAENQANIEAKEAGLYYHDENLEYSAVDYTYKYAGADPDVNNYVCFQGDDCTDAKNLFRIINVDSNTNQTKLITAKSLGYMSWNTKEAYVSNSTDSEYGNFAPETSYTNIWAKSFEPTYTSSLNDYLNETYLYSLGNKNREIVYSGWNTKGVSWEDIRDRSVSDFRWVEMDSPEEWGAYIGLMYATDAGFATLPENWLKGVYGDADYSTSWVAMLGDSWTITRLYMQSNMGDSTFDVLGAVKSNQGAIGLLIVDQQYDVFPTFYLSAKIKITNASVEGVGSKDKPMIIA